MQKIFFGVKLRSNSGLCLEKEIDRDKVLPKMALWLGVETAQQGLKINFGFWLQNSIGGVLCLSKGL